MNKLDFAITLSYFALYLIPGFALVCTSRIRKHRFLLSYSISISLFAIACLVKAIPLSKSPSLVFVYLGVFLLALLFTWLIGSLTRRGPKVRSIIGRRTAQYTPRSSELVSWPPLALIGLFMVYLIWIGPYTELPSDFWQHLARIKDEALTILQNSAVSTISFNGSYAYKLHALLTAIFGISQVELIFPATAFSSIVLLLSFYFFYYWVIYPSIAPQPTASILAFVSVIVTFVCFGVDQFSYFRYYALAPTIIAFPLFLTGTITFVEAVRNADNRLFNVFCTVGLGIVAGLLHLQELLFLMIFAGVFLVVYLLSQKKQVFPKLNELFHHPLWLLFPLFFLAPAGLLFFFEAPSPGALDSRFIHLSFLPDALGPLYLLNPTQQFYGVLGGIGVFAYICFVLLFSRFRNNPYLVTVMIIPIVTVFNPFFLSFFFHFTSPYHAWRVLYMTPFGLVAVLGGWLVFSRVGSQKNRLLVTTLFCSITVSASLFDILTSPRSPLLVRYLTLRPINGHGLDQTAWPGIARFLGTIEKPVQVVSDPVTSHFVRGYTRHHADGFKFHTAYDSVALNKVFKGGKAKHLMHPELKDRILIFNQQDGPLSQLGSVSGHWPEDILKVSSHYPEELQTVIDGNSERFLPIWQVGNATIYRLRTYEIDEILWNTFK